MGEAKACVIGHITVKDAAQWAEYRRRVPDTLAPWGAQLLLRGDKAAVLGGSHRHQATVVILFPDLDAVSGWHASPAYQALIPLRERAAEVDLISYAI
ncbi:DUF1330 domain-containing protein [Azospira restricta]|uniref:DUF1330 domain-containing protein n=1 Tax=Azospira restricta TaxID=404405 RepID=A0A974SQD4_9RHOO|nr:DUF1330 domain-containing protein [Azospira restricta]QRJ64469.1 DUF1330 domain-containing protein [Azospira restricta]